MFHVNTTLVWSTDIYHEQWNMIIKILLLPIGHISNVPCAYGGCPPWLELAVALWLCFLSNWGRSWCPRWRWCDGHPHGLKEESSFFSLDGGDGSPMPTPNYNLVHLVGRGLTTTSPPWTRNLQFGAIMKKKASMSGLVGILPDLAPIGLLLSGFMEGEVESAMIYLHGRRLRRWRPLNFLEFFYAKDIQNATCVHSCYCLSMCKYYTAFFLCIQRDLFNITCVGHICWMCWLFCEWW
jgi:hypothetical protein